MAGETLIEWTVDAVTVDVLDNGVITEITLPPEYIEMLVPGPQGPANTDYQIGGTEPTDPNIKIWYKLT